MKAVKNKSALLSEARQLEQEGQPDAAAELYEQLADDDPLNEEAVGRLLVVYRRLKAYKEELGVIDRTLEAIADRDKTMQQQWLSAHPGAAKLGKNVLRSLGAEASPYGADSFVTQLSRRRTFVQKRISGKVAKGKSARIKEPSAEGKHAQAAARKAIAAGRKRAAAGQNQTVTEHRRAEAARKRAAAEKQRAALEAKRAEAERKRAVAERKRAKAEHEQAAAAARKAADAERRRQAQPSLFVISLRYLVSLEKIDASMEAHVAFLQKHFKSGHFLVAGRQVPRTGGVIIASAKDRPAVERITAEDPFLKKKLASADIVEFKAGTVGPGFSRWLARKR
ncbi:MAG TPA: YciI family protein [Puia sp.]|nr:YciI family protein [Puia sp.]